MGGQWLKWGNPQQMHTDTQTHRHTDTDTQTHRHTDTQTHRHTDTVVCFCELWGHSIGVMVFILYKPYFLSPYTNPTPKPTPYRKLCAFLLSQQKYVWFINLLKYGDMGTCPHKSPSPCNTHVIPMSLYKFVSSYVTKARTHTHTHTCTLGTKMPVR